MAKVTPFQPYRYSAAAGPLDQLVTQPYDKISPAMQERYLAQSPYNLVRIILGPKSPSDTESDNVYTRGAKYFQDWIAQGILVKDAAPSFFAYFQEFEVPDSGERAVRKGFIGLGGVEEYSAGVVHRHEQTLSGPKKDRLQVLEHTHAHFGQLFMLYPDVEGAVDRMLDEAAAGAPLCSVTDEYGTVHKLWQISDPEKTARISTFMEDKKLIIADGHHRYETALAYHNAHPEMNDARNVMMTFVNMYSPGLKILPTHRLINRLQEFSFDEFLHDAGEEFRIRELKSLQELKQAWAEPHKNLIRFGVAATGTDSIYLLERERQPQELDVPVLHELVIQEALGVDQTAVRDEKNIRYIRGAEAALDEVRQGRAQLALLLEATSVEDVANVSFSGGVMPQKSTDFYPKLLTGLAIYRLES